MTAPQRVAKPRSVEYRLTLIFAILGLVLTLLIVLHGFLILEPAMRADGRTHARMIAQAQARMIATLISNTPRERLAQELSLLLDELLLVRDEATEQPIFYRITLYRNEDRVSLFGDSERTLAALRHPIISRGEAPCHSCFRFEIPLYDPNDQQLIAISQFDSSMLFVNLMIVSLRGQLMIGGGFILIVVIGAWLMTTRLLRLLDTRETQLQNEQRFRVMANELERYTKKLQELTAALTMAEQRERERLAKVLHDHLQQLLVGARLGIERARKQPLNPATEHILATIKELLQQSLDTSRSLIADLSPPILHEGNLSAALKWLARTMKTRYALDITLELDTELSPHRPEVRHVLFEAVREALLNVIKHAQGAATTVQLKRQDAERLRLSITDQGCGVDVDQLLDRDDGLGFGLLTMRERLRALGGQFELHSAPGQGLRLTLIAPLGEPAPSIPAVVELPAVLDSAPTAAPTVLQILIVDDHPLIRDSLAERINAAPDMAVVGMASDGQQALAAVERLKPSWVVMDLALPKVDGVTATRLIRQHWPAVMVIGFSVYGAAEGAKTMLDAGACAFVSKSEGIEQLLVTIRQCATAS